MKKTLFLIILFLTLFLIGCNTPKSNEKQLTFDFEIKQVNIYKDSNEIYDSEYNVYTISNQNDINSIVNSLKNIKYNENQSKSNLNEQSYKYVINLKDKYDILIIDNSNFILHINSFYKICEVISGDFDFLNSIEFGDKIETVTPKYNSEDLNMIILEYNNMNINLTSNHYVKELLLKAKFYVNENTNEDVKLLFVLHLGNEKTLSIYEKGIVGYSEPTILMDKAFKVSNNEFDVIKDVIEGEAQSFNFESYESITAYNNEDVSTQIKEKEIEEFIKNFDNIKYVKVKNFKQYTLGDIKYKLNIDGTIIGIYNSNMIIINDDLYIVTEGNFDFLDEIKFNTSSGWLPWV